MPWNLTQHLHLYPTLPSGNRVNLLLRELSEATVIVTGMSDTYSGALIDPLWGLERLPSDGDDWGGTGMDSGPDMESGRGTDRGTERTVATGTACGVNILLPIGGD